MSPVGPYLSCIPCSPVLHCPAYANRLACLSVWPIGAIPQAAACQCSHRECRPSQNSMAAVSPFSQGNTAPPTLVRLAWQKYRKQLQEKPLRTKALTAACISGLSDVIAQRVAASSSKHNWGRTLKMALFGLIWAGPSAHYWQDFLQRLFGGRADAGTVLQKVVLDQLTYGPVCNILFMSFMALAINGQSLPELRTKLARDYPSVQLQGWKVWPLAGLINYRFVPLQLRVLFINLVALCWSTFLNLRSRAAVKTVVVKAA